MPGVLKWTVGTDGQNSEIFEFTFCRTWFLGLHLGPCELNGPAVSLTTPSVIPKSSHGLTTNLSSGSEFPMTSAPLPGWTRWGRHLPSPDRLAVLWGHSNSCLQSNVTYNRWSSSPKWPGLFWPCLLVKCPRSWARTPILHLLCFCPCGPFLQLGQKPSRPPDPPGQAGASAHLPWLIHAGEWMTFGLELCSSMDNIILSWTAANWIEEDFPTITARAVPDLSKVWLNSQRSGLRTISGSLISLKII